MKVKMKAFPWTIWLAALAILCAGCSFSAPDESGEGMGTPSSELEPALANGIPYTIETLAENLDVPWEMAFAPDGRIFLTERSGQIRIIKDDQLLEAPAYTFEEPFITRSEGGLLGLAIDPDFSSNAYVYAYHTYEENGEIANRIVRLLADGDELTMDKVLLEGIPGSNNHNGGRMRFGPDHYLYVTTGDRYEPELAQDMESLGGKILRMTADGGIPESNPYAGSLVYSLGHRNAQGLAWHPHTGQLFSSEHGQSAKDEINLIKPGANYGWPLIEGYETKKGLESPIAHSGSETWAPSGMTFVSEGPWEGKLLIGNLRGTQVLLVSFTEGDPAQVASIEKLWEDEWGRIRNVTEGPDGSLYILTNNRDGRGQPREGDDRIIRLIPE
ncbi:PQQ-dependent sugar dehydrogenase [Paenibacillus senegalensis]|uniref:PQQ-dependent sugar dehydrogenase n=1 Tax=Paenibacillus senegalensis TaxID=1465766 RepID=UPI0002891D15|nr:PQQ-dependent sugar dehydrogenase [Paenibacillus senegalensis]